MCTRPLMSDVKCKMWAAAVAEPRCTRRGPWTATVSPGALARSVPGTCLALVALEYGREIMDNIDGGDDEPTATAY